MDPSWEFQAPQFVDFNSLGSSSAPGEDKADEFFNVDMESGQSWTGAPAQESAPEGGTGLVVRDAPLEQEEKVEKEQEKEQEKEVEKPKRPANMVTSWGKAATKVVSGQTSQAPRQGKVETPKRKALRAAVSATIDNIRNSPKMTFRRTPKRLGTNQPSPRVQGNRSSPRIAAQSRLTPGAVRSPQSTVQRSLARPSAAHPRTPEVMRKYKDKMAQGAKTIREASSRLTKPTSSSLLKAQPAIKHGLAVKPQVMSKPTLTLPKEFNLSSKPAVRAPTGADAPDFSRMLRSYQAAGAGATRPTQPQPFPRQERTRSSSQDTQSRFKSQAEQVASFHRQTPDRFRSRPMSREKTPNKRNRSASPAPRLTIPQTPVLATRARGRQPNVLSQAELEELEMEEHVSKQFKAHGVGETLPKFRHGEVEKKTCTVPEPFSLTAPSYKPAPRVEEAIPAFTARPVSKNMLSRPGQLPDRKEMPLIVPQSPAFCLKSRMAERNQQKAVAAAVTEPEPLVRARPAPHRGIPVSLPAVAKKSTQPEPFSFEQRDQSSMAKKEEKIQKFLDEEKAAREFHAKPILRAVETGGRLPEKQQIALTQTQPFRMAIDERVENRLAKWQEGVARELEDQRRAKEFHAKEAKVLHSAPFVTKPSDKPLSEIHNFTLHSDRRAEERAQYELERTAKEAGLEGARRQQEERRKREEEEDIQKQRKAAVHKAQPVKYYKPLELKPSDRPLTLPASPHFQAGKKKQNATFNQ